MKKGYTKFLPLIMALIFVFGLSFSMFGTTAYARGSGSTSTKSSTSTSTKSSTPTSGYKSGSFSGSSTSKSGTSSGSTSSSTPVKSSTPTSGSTSGSFSSSSSPTTSKSSTSSSTSSSPSSGSTSSSTVSKPSTSSTSSTTASKPSSDTSSSANTGISSSSNNTTKTTNSNTTVVNNSTPSHSSGSTFVFIPHRTVVYDDAGVSHYSYSSPSALGYVVDIIVILIIIGIIIYFIKRIKTKKSEVNKMSADKFLELELDESKKLYSEVIYALDEIGDFVPQQDLKKRRYVKFLPTIKTYVDMVEKAITEAESKNTFSKLFGSNKKSIDLIEDFKEDNQEAFKETKNCMNCKCFKCSKICKMEGCNRCEAGKGCRIVSCDNKTNAVYLFRNKKIPLINNKTGREDMYNVLGVVQDIDAKNYNSELPDYGQLYIIIELDGERFTLYFYPGISDDEYGEIEDVEDFNFATEAFKNVES